jgi:hypothetical protein
VLADLAFSPAINPAIGVQLGQVGCLSTSAFELSPKSHVAVLAKHAFVMSAQQPDCLSSSIMRIHHVGTAAVCLTNLSVPGRGA